MDEDYRGQHQAPSRDDDVGAPLHDTTGVYPSDLYGPNGLHYYGDKDDPIDQESYRHIVRVKGNPEAPVWIHRAIPTEVYKNAMKHEDPINQMIRKGDWVTPTKAYAKQHGESVLDGKYKIASKRVKAKDVFTNGDSLNEWGYDPTPHKDEGGGITAYHGSPHDFDQFDTAKIGTGEGAQAYGHGLYFAESEPIAQHYRDALAYPADPRNAINDVIRQFKDYKVDEPTHENVKNWIKDISSLKSYVNDERITKRIHGIINAEDDDDAFHHYRELDNLLPPPSKGHMYEVHIDAHPDHFLDWDKPLSEQSDHVQSKIGSLMHMTSHERNTMPIRSFYEMLGTPQEASQRLSNAGIHGIKYLDASSRKEGEGTRNYVVFDHNRVNVKRKYEQGGSVHGDNFIPHGDPRRAANLDAFEPIRDESGAPRVFYHGTSRRQAGEDMDNNIIWKPTPDIKKFKTNSQMGAHFGTKEQSHDTGFIGEESRDEGQIYPVHLNIKNPIRLKDTGSFNYPAVKSQLRDMGHDVSKLDTMDDMKDYLKSIGHDGIVYLNRREGLKNWKSGDLSPKRLNTFDDRRFKEVYPEAQDSYIAFDPHQIKSAIGNNGNFDKNSPNINEARGGAVGFANGGKIDTQLNDKERASSDHVTAPVRWQSAPDHPPTRLAYITDAEARLLKQLDLHGSGVRFEDHFGPKGVPSFDGTSQNDAPDSGGGGIGSDAVAGGTASDSGGSDPSSSGNGNGGGSGNDGGNGGNSVTGGGGGGNDTAPSLGGVGLGGVNAFNATGAAPQTEEQPPTGGFLSNNVFGQQTLANQYSTFAGGNSPMSDPTMSNYDLDKQIAARDQMAANQAATSAQNQQRSLDAISGQPISTGPTDLIGNAVNAMRNAFSSPSTETSPANVAGSGMGGLNLTSASNAPPAADLTTGGIEDPSIKARTEMSALNDPLGAQRVAFDNSLKNAMAQGKSAGEAYDIATDTAMAVRAQQMAVKDSIYNAQHEASVMDQNAANDAARMDPTITARAALLSPTTNKITQPEGIVDPTIEARSARINGMTNVVPSKASTFDPNKAFPNLSSDVQQLNDQLQLANDWINTPIIGGIVRSQIENQVGPITQATPADEARIASIVNGANAPVSIPDDFGTDAALQKYITENGMVTSGPNRAGSTGSMPNEYTTYDSNLNPVNVVGPRAGSSANANPATSEAYSNSELRSAAGTPLEAYEPSSSYAQPSFPHTPTPDYAYGQQVAPAASAQTSLQFPNGNIPLPPERPQFEDEQQQGPIGSGGKDQPQQKQAYSSDGKPLYYRNGRWYYADGTQYTGQVSNPFLARATGGRALYPSQIVEHVLNKISAPPPALDPLMVAKRGRP